MNQNELNIVMNSPEVQNFKRGVMALISDEKGKEVKNSTEARVDMFSKEIVKYLNPDNTFLQFSKQDTRLASSGKTMTLPQSAANPSVVKGKFNPETKGNGDDSNVGTVTVRRNTNKTYTIEYFGTAPQVINLPEMTELSYDARQDLLESHANAILNEIANFAIIEWALDDNTEGYLIKATGVTRNSEVDNLTLVKGIAKNDITNAAAILNAQNLPVGTSLYALPTPQQYADLIKALDISYLTGGFPGMLEKGLVGQISGVNILKPRQNDAWNANVLYDTETVVDAYSKVALGATPDGTTDASALMIWSSKSVFRAQGAPKVYNSLSDPLYKGDVYCSEVRFGATRGRADNKGVVAIVEDIQAGGAE